MLEDSADWNRWRGAIDTRMGALEREVKAVRIVLEDFQKLKWKIAGAASALSVGGGILAQLFFRWWG